ncbi:DMT family transporter [Lysinibacillus sphaericus]|uniref:EamA family transporter n=3 Tax=Lysinibacillus TaxID=400634 RepID=A0A2S0K1Z3_LYSSH|nr:MULTISPECIES: DMT family transporter [Lysinibacillus]AHN21548.1 transporter [Lysinibacillus varians]AVK97329.1 EamA family transporter [Lysinibacillus sphaericus]MED4542634.1 DMT family transporter [Lysinibacillus sphaericus]TKI19983.1 DMT family transporter [Lysinibacillus sphaericus]TKI47703.1 DMT family transporter [Lysinibacillus tabacifolii]
MNVSAIIKLTVSMAIFGSIGFFTIHTGLPATELVFIRCVCATLFLGALWLITGGHKTEVWNKKELLRTLLCGVFIVLNWVFLFKAFEEMSISIAISIYNLAPIFVLILGALLLKEKMTVQALVATITCFIGSIFIIGLQNFISLSEFMQSGFVWALLSALFYAFTMLTSRTIKNLSAYALTFIQTAVGIVMLVPFVDFSLFEGLTTTNWLYILGTGFIHTGFVYYLFFDSIRSLSTILVSVLVFVDPVVAILLDMLLLDFMPSPIQTLGILLIFGGIFYTIYIPKQKAHLQE